MNYNKELLKICKKLKIEDSDIEYEFEGSKLIFLRLGKTNFPGYQRGDGLRVLPEGLFDKLSSLKRLVLSYNQFTKFPPGIFDKLKSLERLDLHHNRLTLLPHGIFDKLTSLERLDLSENNLTELSKGIFDNLVVLDTLRLYNNQLTKLPQGIFDQLESIYEIDLEGNKISSPPIEMNRSYRRADIDKLVREMNYYWEDYWERQDTLKKIKKSFDAELKVIESIIYSEGNYSLDDVTTLISPLMHRFNDNWELDIVTRFRDVLGIIKEKQLEPLTKEFEVELAGNNLNNARKAIIAILELDSEGDYISTYDWKERLKTIDFKISSQASDAIWIEEEKQFISLSTELNQVISDNNQDKVIEIIEEILKLTFKEFPIDRTKFERLKINAIESRRKEELFQDIGKAKKKFDAVQEGDYANKKIIIQKIISLYRKLPNRLKEQEYEQLLAHLVDQERINIFYDLAKVPYPGNLGEVPHLELAKAWQISVEDTDQVMIEFIRERKVNILRKLGQDTRDDFSDDIWVVDQEIIDIDGKIEAQMRCIACGQELSTDSQYCISCGTSL